MDYPSRYHAEFGCVDMKYILVRVGVPAKRMEDKTTFLTLPILFPRVLAHNLMLEGVHASCYLGNEPLTGPQAITAGFFRVINGVVDVYGHSETLGLASRPEDAAIIQAFLS